MKIYHIGDFVNTAEALPLWVLQEKNRTRAEAPHQHDCIEIMYIEKGAGRCIMNRTCYPVLRGDFFIFRPGDVHEFVPSSPLSYYNLLFSGELFSPEEKKVLAAHPLLAVPKDVYASLESYAEDTEAIERHRLALAREIERLTQQEKTK